MKRLPGVAGLRRRDQAPGRCGVERAPPGCGARAQRQVALPNARRYAVICCPAAGSTARLGVSSGGHQATRRQWPPFGWGSLLGTALRAAWTMQCLLVLQHMSGVYVGKPTGIVRMAVCLRCEVSSCKAVLIFELQSRGSQGSPRRMTPAGTVRARLAPSPVPVQYTSRGLVSAVLDLPGPVRAYLSLYPSCGLSALVPEPVPCLLHGAG